MEISEVSQELTVDEEDLMFSSQPVQELPTNLLLQMVIRQKYNVREEKQGEQSPAKPPERVVREYHSPYLLGNRTPQQKTLHIREFFEVIKTRPEEQRNQQRLHAMEGLHRTPV